jgi:PAS domain S-box-containing protein
MPIEQNGSAAPELDSTQIGAAEHLVQFYEDDASLIESVSAFLASGLAAGEGILVLASAEHAQRFQRQIEAHGIDLEEAVRRGQFVALDAAETVSQIIDNGDCDSIRFERVVGQQVARLASRWPRIRAFGEMVSVLWKRGQRDAACQLEQFWNDLGRKHTFALWCAYDLRDFADAADSALFDRICTCHTRVIPAESYAAMAAPEDRLRQITALQQRAAALEREIERRSQAERELSDLLENAPEALNKISPDGRILWANRVELDRLGYARDEYVGRHVSEFHADRATLDALMQIVGRGGHLHDFPARLRAKNGSIRHVRISSNARFEQGQLAYLHCFTRDVTDAVQAEQDRALLAAIVESTDEAIYSTDLDGTVTSWNGAAARLFGYRAEEIIGRPLTVIMPPDRHEEHHEFLSLIRAGQRIEHVETVRQRSDGSRVDVSLTVSPIMDSRGKIVGASRIVRDVTQIKKTAAELAESEQRYRRLCELLPVGVYTCSAPDGAITYFNDQAVALWGRTPELGESAERFCGCFRLFLPDGTTFVPPDECAMALALREGRAYRNLEVIMERPDGSRFFALVNIDPVRDAAGKVVGAINVFHDASALKQAERLLREQKENLQTLLDTLPVSVFIAQDPECRRISGNRAAAELLRMAHDANLSKTAPTGEVPAHFQVTRNGVPVAGDDLPLQRAARGEVIHCDELDLHFDDAKTVHTVVSARPLYDPDGRTRGAVGSILDITNIKKVESMLREVDRRKDQFLATLAHELRNPLAPIRMGLQLLKLSKHDSSVLDDTLGAMDRQTEQLISLVDDLLDVSRITQGKLQLRKCRVELAQIIQSAVEAVSPLIQECHHRLDVMLPDGPLHVHADPHRLAQVVSNLLNNAAKYTPEGGRIRLLAQQHGRDLVLTVRDNGIGIPRDQLQSVFEMFVQIDRPVEQGYTGLGIGLTLVKSLVEMHDGTITVHSDGPHAGAEFSVRLPVVEQAAAAESSPSDGLNGTLRPATRRVLVVDDNKAAATILSMVVKTLGHHVCTAGDGQEAVELAEAFRPDVILMDIGMPGMNGYQAAEHIREQPWGRDILLVALTGWSHDESRRKTREAGFDHHLVKPADAEDLQRLLTELPRTTLLGDDEANSSRQRRAASTDSRLLELTGAESDDGDDGQPLR